MEITEVMTRNVTYCLDAQGRAHDWVELHNASNAPVSLSGWSLSDDAQKRGKWTFPDATIPAGGYLIVYCSGTSGNASELHASFRLSGEGTQVILTRADGQTASAVDVPALEKDQSWSKQGGGWTKGLSPTPGQSNDFSGAAAGQIITNKAERIPDLADWLTERDGGRLYLLLRGAENDSLASDLSDLYKNAVRRTAGADCAGEEIQKTDDAAEAAALTAAYLADHPDIGTIVCAGDAQTVGAVQGVEGAGRTDVTVICLNGESDDIASLVEEGRVAAAVVRSPERVALAAAEMLDNFFNTSAYSLRERYYVSADILTADGIQLPD